MSGDAPTPGADAADGADGAAAADGAARTVGPDPVDRADVARYEARVLRSFVREERLISIPAQDRKRQVILRWLLATAFPEDVPYEERDVNMRLALIHRDVAALRRYLVEAGLMTRASGVYRRVSGAG